MKSLIKSGITLFAILIVFIQVDAQSPKKAMKAGKAQLKEYKYDGAIQSFTEAIGINPKLVDAYVLRGQAYEKSNKLQEAADDYSKASDLSPKNPKLCYDAGRLFYILGKNMDAIHMLNQAITINKGYLEAYLVKVNCLVMLKNYSEALSTCDQALLLRKTALNYFNHGMVSEKLNNDKIAETDYRKSIQIDKKFQQSYVGLANVLSRQNKNDEALKYCNQIILLYPSYTDAFTTRASINYKKSDLTNALTDISKAVDLDPQNDRLYFIRAGYNYELTDRLVATLNNAFNLEFLNYNKQEKFLTNILDFRLRYFIEDNLSLNAAYEWNYQVTKFNYYENYTNNNHSINIGFTYYFEKGFLVSDSEQPLAMELPVTLHPNYIYSTINKK